MISHKYKCIFVEVPKTGSSSMRAILGTSVVHQNIWQLKYELENYWTSYDGLRNRILSSLYILLPKWRRKELGIKKFNSYFKFGFVRNPWDRTVSLYNRREGLQMRDKMTFEEFVNWINYSSATCYIPVPHRYQIDWFVDPHGNVIVDFIGKFENISEDWSYVSKRINVNMHLPHKNINPDKKMHYSEYYTEKTKDIIAKKFKIDIEYFGYEFIDMK